jgi:hypothetical protein
MTIHICKGEQNILSKIKNKKNHQLNPNLKKTKRIEAMVCFLFLTLVFAHEPFSTFFERKIK